MKSSVAGHVRRGFPWPGTLWDSFRIPQGLILGGFLNTYAPLTHVSAKVILDTSYGAGARVRIRVYVGVQDLRLADFGVYRDHRMGDLQASDVLRSQFSDIAQLICDSWHAEGPA